MARNHFLSVERSFLENPFLLPALLQYNYLVYVLKLVLLHFKQSCDTQTKFLAKKLSDVLHDALKISIFILSLYLSS